MELIVSLPPYLFCKGKFTVCLVIDILADGKRVDGVISHPWCVACQLAVHLVTTCTRTVNKSATVSQYYISIFHGFEVWIEISVTWNNRVWRVGETGASSAPGHVRPSHIFRSLNNILKGARTLETRKTDTICFLSKRRLYNENPRIRIENSLFGTDKYFFCFDLSFYLLRDAFADD